MIQPAQKNGKEFLNPIPTTLMEPGAIWYTLWQYIVSKEEVVPKIKPGPFITDPNVFKTNPTSGLRITWIGHSTLLIEIDGLRILTDPVWSSRASFVSFAGPKRFFPAPLSLSSLPALEAIIISHDHYDHLDAETIKKLADKQIPFYCSLGVGQHLQKWGIRKEDITEMNWGDNARIKDQATITATPARHFSGRSMINRNRTLWSSFVIKTNRHNIFFGADSGWFPGFETIGNTFGPFDLTMLEIGAYNKNWANIHMGPENAANAHLALKGKIMMPIHWGTFNLALHAWKEPVEKLMGFAKQKNIELFLPEPGKPTEVNGQSYNSSWWEKY
jgi:L-ascorbate metabolism protein UlaG (beta-lactamase superfamily)